MKPIKTALCSFGMSGWVFHAPFIHSDHGFEFYAVWERSKNRAEEKYPSIVTYRSLDELLADDKVELVVVNTPNYTHFEYAKKALLAGKHVIVEKPFTVRSGEADKLIALAKKNRLVLSVYHNRRYDSDYRTVRKVIGSGVLGKIVEAEIHYDRFKADLSPKIHKETPGGGTGALYDLGSHLIDQAVQLFGMPESLFADIRTIRPHSQVDDYFELLFYYSEFRVRLKCSYLVCEALPAYIFHGTNGSFIKAKTDVQEMALQAGKQPGSPEWGKEPESEKGLLHTISDGKDVRELIPSLSGNYGDYYREMYRAIREQGPVPVLPEDGRKVINIIELAFQSSHEKKVVEL